jgi:hypothetical protein
MAYSDEFIKHLEELAYIYIEECLSNTKEMISNRGDIVHISDRHIPTIDYFLRIWIPLVRKEKSIHRDTYYTWLNSDDKLKSDTIKKIDNVFKCLAKDIVANEGKGIFYAKNALGMHDKQHLEQKNVERFDFE